MFWLFAFGIIALCVFHTGFRKLVLALIAGTAVVILCIVMYSSQQASEHKAQAAAEIARYEAQQAKLPKCPTIENDDPDVPYSALHDCRSDDPFGDALKQPADDADIPASLAALVAAQSASKKKKSASSL